MRDVTTVRAGGDVVQVVGEPESQAMAMSTHVRDVIAQEKAQQAEIAVLVPSNHQARLTCGDWPALVRIPSG